jgi:YHS domain-containing protein
MRSIVAGLLFAVTAVVAACSQRESMPATASTSAASAPVAVAGLTRVTDRSQVCMVNNTFMGRAQIPVEVDGRTYYGCCPACKDRLANDASSRVASDPVTGKDVDKAGAVIAYDGDGKVLYFASEDTLRNYHGAK